MYVCGPTVYDVGHLGHGRSAVAFDVIRRYLLWKGFDVRYVSNITDVEDKMIARATEERITVKELSEKITPEYEEDFGALSVMPPTVRPFATEYVPEMIEIIERLEKNGATYVISDGVYFDVKRFPEYGKLSGQKLEELQIGVRVDINPEKRNPQDFVLWKFKKEGEPFWPSPWGDGRPGWHIECSAMSLKELGVTIDIHGGGADLMFPHHECEIAQSEMGNDAPFVRYWLHNGFINVNEEKMSKSLGNFVTLKKIFERYEPRVVRFFYLQTHYRSPINFNELFLEQAKSALERYDGFLRRLGAFPVKDDANKSCSNLSAVLKSSREKFESCMDDDFEVPGALGAVFELIKEANICMDEEKLSSSDKAAISEFLKDVDRVFVIMPSEKTALPSEIMALIEEREVARKKKDFVKSDGLRRELLKKGVEIEDTAHGPVWKKK